MEQGTMTDLGTLGGTYSKGNAINDLGEVVCTTSTTNGSSAFADQNGKTTVLGLLPGGGGIYTVASGSTAQERSSAVVITRPATSARGSTRTAR
jgi:uncharacterized membrane protein